MTSARLLLVYGTQQCDEFVNKLNKINQQINESTEAMEKIVGQIGDLAKKQAFNQILTDISPKINAFGFKISNIQTSLASVVKELSVFQKPHPLEENLKLVAQQLQNLIQMQKHVVGVGATAVKKLKEITAKQQTANLQAQSTAKYN